MSIIEPILEHTKKLLEQGVTWDHSLIADDNPYELMMVIVKDEHGEILVKDRDEMWRRKPLSYIDSFNERRFNIDGAVIYAVSSARKAFNWNFEHASRILADTRSDIREAACMQFKITILTGKSE